MPTFDLGQQLRDAGFEHFAADDAAISISLGLKGEMLAAAKADLEPDLFDRIGKEATRIQRLVSLGQRKPQLRQQRFDQLALAAAERAAAATAIQPSLRQSIVLA
jgi:hypothetical protein